MTGARVIEFSCPDCKRPCRFSETQRALQHSEPTCKTWLAHKGKGQDFMRLALMAAKGNLVLGDVNASERTVETTQPDPKASQELLEQIYEGLKKL